MASSAFDVTVSKSRGQAGRMNDSDNILEAIAKGNRYRFLELLDKGVKEATRQASADSHALGLSVVDGRGSPKGNERA